MSFSLSLDLSAAIGTLAVHRGAALLCEAAISDSFHHSERLIDVLSESLSSVELELSAMDRFVTTAGPGSFTGLRIAIASLKAFAMAYSRPVETVSSAEARALGWVTANPAHSTKSVCVLTHSSMDRYIQTRFRRDGMQLELMDERLTTAAEISNEANELVTLFDERAKERLNNQKGESYLFPSHARYLTLEPAASRKRHASLQELINLSPLYYGETKFKEVATPIVPR